MKNFEKEYEIYEGIKKAFDAASDEAGKDAARASYQEWAAGVDAKGKAYADTYRMYQDAREAGNSYIDVRDSFFRITEQEFIDQLRSLGVEFFTFSATWSSAVESSWAFVQAGCTVEGMVQVFTGFTKGFGSTEPETRPAFLYKVN